MRRLLFSLLFLTYVFASQAAEGIALGYCNGQVTRSGTVSVDGETWVDAAILLTADMLSPYAGGHIVAVRAGLAARTNIDNVRVWVRKSLDGDELANGQVSADGEPGILRGWNEIELGTPYPIADGESLYVGLSYQQRAASSALSVVEGSADGAFFFRGGEGAAWEDRSSSGLLSLEAVVMADNVAAYDLELFSATARYNAQGVLEMQATVHNNGTQPVSGFTLTTTVDGSTEHFDYHYGQELAKGGLTTLSFTADLPVEGLGKTRRLTMAISQLDGEAADEAPANNAQSVVFSYQRRVLIEEFTAEECTNCPRAARLLHNVLGQGNNADHAVMVAHHSGYTPDFLTFRPSDIDYEWLFNHPVAVYAPGLMFDRVAQEATFGADVYLTPVVDPVSEDFISAALSYSYTQPSSAYLELQASGSDATLSVTVSGGRSQVFGLTPTRLTVGLVEDHIAQRAQVSLDQWPEFEHTGALRAINTTWGDVVEWDADDHFTATYQFTLDPEWQRENLRVVAFLNDYDPDDPARCSVENSEQLSLSGLTEAISDATSSQRPVSTTIYNADGRRSANVHSGLNIVRQTFADGTTHTKTILK